jgi:hypothetical protein
LDWGDLRHGRNRRYRLDRRLRCDAWHRWERRDGRDHPLSVGRGPHLIGGAYGRRADEEWSEPKQDDHYQGSASHRICPPWHRAMRVCTLLSRKYAAASWASQQHRCGGVKASCSAETRGYLNPSCAAAGQPRQATLVRLVIGGEGAGLESDQTQAGHEATFNGGVGHP